MSLARRLVAEALGAAFLLAAVVGSGIMAERLAQGNLALALLANTAATAAALFFLIVVFGPVSGAHFNPAVTLVAALSRRFPPHEAALYALAQIGGAFAGVAAAHLMFDEPLFSASGQVRAGAGQVFSEFVATFGLILAVLGTARAGGVIAAATVAAYIGAAYWFTASTSFANPAVTLARAATDTFSGIRAADVPAFLVAQLAGALAAMALFGWMERSKSSTFEKV